MKTRKKNSRTARATDQTRAELEALRRMRDELLLVVLLWGQARCQSQEEEARDELLPYITALVTGLERIEDEPTGRWAAMAEAWVRLALDADDTSAVGDWLIEVLGPSEAALALDDIGALSAALADDNANHAHLVERLGWSPELVSLEPRTR